MADWADIAGTDPTLPFLADRVTQAGPTWRAPLPEVSRLDTPTALILHAGRCGSTLVSRALSRMTRCHVLAEPQALNDVLSVDGIAPFMDQTRKGEAVRRVVGALARAARPEQSHFILKLSSWNALHLPLLDALFPAVPKLFIYREPEEILVSLLDEPAAWMRRAANRMQAGLFLGLPPTRVLRTPLGFAAQVLGRTLAAAANSIERSGQTGQWLLIPYDTLPDALTTRILPWLGLETTVAEAETLARHRDIHAKDSAGLRPFLPDASRKRAAVTAELAKLAHDLVRHAYGRLESLRLRDAGGED